MTTYKAIKALPGKFNWPVLIERLEALHLQSVGRAYDHSRDVYAGQSGVRAMRFTAMELATSIVFHAETRSTFIPPSEQTLSEGGFLGGETVVWKDADAGIAATKAVCDVIRFLQNGEAA